MTHLDALQLVCGGLPASYHYTWQVDGIQSYPSARTIVEVDDGWAATFWYFDSAGSLLGMRVVAPTDYIPDYDTGD